MGTREEVKSWLKVLKKGDVSRNHRPQWSSKSNNHRGIGIGKRHGEVGIGDGLLAETVRQRQGFLSLTLLGCSKGLGPAQCYSEPSPLLKLGLYYVL